jgi:molybdenum cofactor cytidylyltransferase
VIAGIVLAAGRSSRLRRPKQLLPVHGEPLLRYTVRRVLASGLDDVLVVVGHAANSIRAAIADLPVTVVENPEYELGQSTSVRAGLAALPPETDAAVFLLGDQPGVSSEVIDRLIDAWQASGAPVVAPRYADGIGNPILFDHRVFPEFAHLTGDTGAKPIVEAHKCAGDLVTVSTPGPTPRDIDTEEDYERLLASLPNPPRPPTTPQKNPSPIAMGEGEG